MKKQTFTFILISLFISSVQAQVIDVHMHGYNDEGYWGGQTHPYTQLDSPKTADGLLKATIAEMDKNNIEYAVICCKADALEMWANADSRFIPGYSDEEELIPIEEFEEKIKNGQIRVFGEVLGVYMGRTLNDPIYDPYLKLCEQYGIPVAYHTGGGPPMTPYTCCPDFRISHGDPLKIEDVLVKYPRLKIYLMHAGEVFFENAVRMMSLYRQLYVDLGVLLWVDPMVQDYAVRFLKLGKNAGVLDRVMFGSDQMVWPGAISNSIEFFNSLDFLTEEEKHKILYSNAKGFLDID